METIHVSTEPGGVLLLTFKGEVNDTTDVKSFKSDIDIVSKKIKELHKSQGSGIKVMIDITDFVAEYVSDIADALVELAKEDKSLVEKTAVFGGSLKIRIMGETIAELAGRHNIKFFENKSSALAWLHS